MRIAALCLALGLTLTGCGGVAVDEPKFALVVRDGAFEVRDYPALTVAEVTVSGGQWRAANMGFELLAGYIFGGNSRRAGVAGVGAVTEARAGEKIAMTAPVTQTEGDAGWVVRFIMPAGATRRRCLCRMMGGCVWRWCRGAGGGGAVLGVGLERGRGGADWGVAGVDGAAGLVARGAATLAQYSPPWTLWFLRRNEVMIPVGE